MSYRRTHYGIQTAQDGAEDEHLSDLDVDRQRGEVVPQGGEGVCVRVACPDLAQQTQGGGDRVGVGGVKRP